MNDPVYTDTDFDDVDRSVDGADLLWPGTCKDVMRAAGRKHMVFKTDAEEARWRRVEKQLEAEEHFPDWVKHRCAQGQLHGWGFVIMMHNILNMAAYDDWVTKAGRAQPVRPVGVYPGQRHG